MTTCYTTYRTGLRGFSSTRYHKNVWYSLQGSIKYPQVALEKPDRYKRQKNRKEWYICVNCDWKTEKDKYPFSLTDKGKAAWRNFRISWDDFLERYLKYGEEFLLKYNGVEYHLAFHNEEKKKIAEFNFGTQVSSYMNLEYPSAEALLENAKICGKSIQEIWELLTVE